MGSCIVVVEQQAVCAVVWTACTPLKDLEQANVDYHSALTISLPWNGTECTRPDLAKKSTIICLGLLLDL